MKKIVSLLLSLMVSFGIAVTAFAEVGVYRDRLVDEADLLTDAEEEILRSELDEISTRQEFDVVVVTTDSLYGETPGEYADDFYDDYGYGYGPNGDGVLLLVSMEDRDWYVSTCGYGMTALTDNRIEAMSDLFVPKMSQGDYAAAFLAYAYACDEYVTQTKAEIPYDGVNLPKEPFPLGKNLLIALVIGLVIALIVVTVMKGKLKTVRPQDQADYYMKSGSMQVTRSQDLFLYHTVHRTAKPKDNGSGGRSSGGGSRSHGGGGGKF